MIIVQIILGGITRLTDSGLSITEWQPLLGAVPPTSEAEWNKAFESYKRALNFSPDDYRTLIATGFLHEKLGNFEQAIVDALVAAPAAQIIAVEELIETVQNVARVNRDRQPALQAWQIGAQARAHVERARPAVAAAVPIGDAAGLLRQTIRDASRHRCQHA